MPVFPYPWQHWYHGLNYVSPKDEVSTLILQNVTLFGNSTVRDDISKDEVITAVR
jgi:hypothetical protein